MRASLRAEYGIDLRQVVEGREMRPTDLADLVVWLPAGCAFWRSMGGPASVSQVERELREAHFWLRVLDYRERGSKGDPPKRAPEPVWAYEKKTATAVADRKAAAYLARQQRRG